MRRRLTLDHLGDAILRAKKLLETGYTKSGNWSLGQMCCHLRKTIESNMSGYPLWMTILGYPLRPLLRYFLLPRLLSGKSPNGVRTAGIFIPPQDLDDSAEVELFAHCVAGVHKSSDRLHAHPGFGAMSQDEFNRFHAAHAAHHFSFLKQQEIASDANATE